MTTTHTHSSYCIENAVAAIRESNKDLAPEDRTAETEQNGIEWMRDGLATDACVCAR